MDGVLAAVAYGSSAADPTQDLPDRCLANQLRLDLSLSPKAFSVQLYRKVNHYAPHVVLIHFRGYRAATDTPADEAMTGVAARNIKPTRPVKAGLR